MGSVVHVQWQTFLIHGDLQHKRGTANRHPWIRRICILHEVLFDTYPVILCIDLALQRQQKLYA